MTRLNGADEGELEKLRPVISADNVDSKSGKDAHVALHAYNTRLTVVCVQYTEQ